MHTFLIAEIASAHDGEWYKAAKLIDLAHDAGFDAAKLQYWSDARRLATRRNVGPEYYAIYRKYQIPAWWLREAQARCVLRGLEFMCTAYLPEDIPIVAGFVTRFKVASFEAHDKTFVEAHPADRPLVISTGMMTDIQAASMPERAVLLHCVSAYPAPLNAMQLRGGFVVCDGLSDHSADVLTGAVAVGAGAVIIEAHIRLADTDPKNPDHAVALDPEQAMEYVANVRKAERMLGDAEKAPQDCEAEMMRYIVL